MVQKLALERWETRLENWKIAKSHLKQHGLRQNPSQKGVEQRFNGPLGPIFYPSDRANIKVGCLENQFRVHDLCDCDTDHRQHENADYHR
jgi:hypothetical protein